MVTSKASRVAKPLVLAAALALSASATGLAAQLNLETEFIFKVQSAKPAESLFPTELATEQSTIRLRGGESGKWILHLDVAAQGNKGAISWKQPRFRAQAVAPPATFDVWGGGYDLGGAKADPAELMIMGNLGYRPLAWGASTNVVNAKEGKIRTSFKLADANVTADYHQRDNKASNFELYAELPVNADTNVGGMLRQVFASDASNNALGLVGFAKTKVADLSVGGSIGIRTGEKVNGDNLAFGVTATKSIDGGVAEITGNFVDRQKNFYEAGAQDAGFQSGADRFRNVYDGKGNAPAATGKGRILEVLATWKGEENKARPTHNVLHATDVFVLDNLKGPAFQGLVRLTTDETTNPQTILVGRAGSRLAEDLTGVVEVKVTRDEDGVGTIGTGSEAVAGKDTRLQIRAITRYNLAKHNMKDWFLIGALDTQTTSDGNKSASSNTVKGEIWYNLGKVRLHAGLSSAGQSGQEKRNNTLYTQLHLLY